MLAQQAALFSVFLCVGVRGQVTGYNWSSTCSWPACAPTCDKCELRPILFSHSNAICKMGVCLCEPPFCAVKNKCRQMQCYAGAQPPPFTLSGWGQWFAKLAPARPVPYAAGIEWWASYGAVVAMQQPLVLAITGCLLAVLTSIYLFTGLEHKYGCMPKHPAFLLCWACVVIIAISVGLLYTHSRMATAYDVGVDELRIMHEGLLTTADVGVQLNTSCAELREHVNAMPATCKHSLAEAGMSGFVDLGLHATASKFEDVIKVTRTMMVVAKLSGLALEVLTEFRWFVLNMPQMPMYTMLLISLLVVVVTGIWWSFHGKGDGKVAKVADKIMLRLGDVCIPLLAAVAGLLAALCLGSGMVAGHFCADLDGNMMRFTRSVNWSAHIKSTLFDANDIMAGAAQYYLWGNRSSPMLNMLQAGQSASHMFDNAVHDARLASNVAGDMCPGLDTVRDGDWLGNIDMFIENMTMLVAASYVWPHYEVMFRRTFCGHALEALGPLFLVFTTLGLLCFPLFGLLAEYDLEEWLESADHEDSDSGKEDARMILHPKTQTKMRVWGH